MRRCIFVFAFFIFSEAESATINQTVYLNRGVFTTVNNTTFPAFAFNESSAYEENNHVINMQVNDILILKVINTDSVIHGFNLKGETGFNSTINPGDSVTHVYTPLSMKLVIYYDAYNFPYYSYAGASGMICVSNGTGQGNFYWNIKEHQSTFNQVIASGGTVDFTTYNPDYYTINGLSHPDLQNDTTATVTGNVGDTLYIFMANTGMSKHSIHVHGFHPVAVYSNNAWIQTGSAKDSWPMNSMDAVILMLVPDKTGRYSVHDHNLIAISAGNIHPNGMFTIMEIQ
jgi:FtsP/CotA-like multicopper oxidase with cupredoxin domain